MKQISKFGLAALLFPVCSLSAWSKVHSASLYPSNGSEAEIVDQKQVTITGVVKGTNGEPLSGVQVLAAGSKKTSLTNAEGKYSIRVSSNVKELVFYYIGFQREKVKLEGKKVVNVTMREKSQALSEVVVTALGIKREKKALGYAMQELKGEDIVSSRETNVANALTGKVSGVQIIRSSNGPGGSSKIQLRGSNSVTGLNQPLIVVDGVPMDNFTGASNNDFWNPSNDMGNGLSDINSEDIESMSVLKGASAAALYGSRAGNGVILITTKKGRKNSGLGITVSSSVGVETIFMKPKRQEIFGQGSNGVYDAKSGSSWGPRIEGQTVTSWDDKKVPLRYYDNVKNFFRTGLTLNENVSFSQMFGKTSIYTSATRLDDMSKIPGADLKRTNLMLRASSTFGENDRWSMDAKVQYMNTAATNRPMSGQRAENYFWTVFSMPSTIDLADFENNIDPKTGKMRWWQDGSGLNPYWAKEYNKNKDKRDRFLMNGSLKYEFTDWLNAEVRAGTDMYFTELETKLFAGSPLTQTGRYSYGQERFYENNFSFLISAQKDRFIAGKWGGSASFGGNMMQRKHRGLKNGVDELIAPDWFWLNNGKLSSLNIDPSYSEKKINSLYGTFGVNYDGWAFLDATFRNDWSSTLSKENRSYFYPSVNLSWIISDMVNHVGAGMPEWFTYTKTRASFAQVGNDLNPYELYNTYRVNSEGVTGGVTAENSSSVLFNSDVRSELISSWEFGTELRFFHNRLGVDFTWYKSNARRQLLNIPMNPLSGFEYKKVNAGNIQNEGIEVMLSANPIRTEDFSWNMTLNFSKNSNKIVKLLDGKEYENMNYELGGYDNLKIYAVAGGNYGEIWGTKFQRVEEGEHKGKLLLNEAGLPQATAKAEKIGDQQAKCLLGFTNSLSYKNFTLNFLIDGRFGGKIFSGTNRMLQASGVAECTVTDGERKDFVLEGVMADGNGGYVVNTTEISPESYWKAVTTSGNLGIGEANLYDATNVRLRNISLNYSFPREMLKKTCLQKVKLGVSCNNVWMMYSKMNGVDPESVFATGTNATGFENAASPTSRSYLFNVVLGF